MWWPTETSCTFDLTFNAPQDLLGCLTNNLSFKQQVLPSFAQLPSDQGLFHFVIGSVVPPANVFQFAAD